MATAAKIEVPPVIPFDPISELTSVSQRWKAWKRRFEIYLIAVNVKDDAQKRALLLYQAGETTQEIFDTLEETGDDYKTAIEKLDQYFTPKKNVDFQFRQASAKQNNGETTSLRCRRYSRAQGGKLDIPPAQKLSILSSAH